MSLPSPIEAQKAAERLDGYMADLARADASGNPSRLGLAAMDASDAAMALVKVLNAIIDHTQALEIAADREAA